MAIYNSVPDFSQMAKDLRKLASRYAASESIKFFTESFVKGGWTDTSFTAWDKTNSALAGNKTMYKSGKLMLSLKKRSESMDRIVIEADSAYAEIHNDGGYITVTERMKKFWWFKYSQFSGKIKTTQKGNVSQSKVNRSVSAKAEFCKRMALMKVGSKIKIPKRQFMGESKTMMNNFDVFWRQQTDNVFKQHLNNNQNGSVE